MRRSCRWLAWGGADWSAGILPAVAGRLARRRKTVHGRDARALRARTPALQSVSLVWRRRPRRRAAGSAAPHLHLRGVVGEIGHCGLARVEDLEDGVELRDLQ